MFIEKIISGGQTGADLGGLKFAELYDIETGGSMPKGFINHNGRNPDFSKRFNMTEMETDKYSPRTGMNVTNSDGTLRIAKNWDSAGELCTLKFIKKYDKPFFDVKLPKKGMSKKEIKTLLNTQIKDFLEWLIAHDIKILNVAGNSEKTAPGIEKWTQKFLAKAYFTYYDQYEEEKNK